jgi:hypothetical protein
VKPKSFTLTHAHDGSSRVGDGLSYKRASGWNFRRNQKRFRAMDGLKRIVFHRRINIEDNTLFGTSAQLM